MEQLPRLQKRIESLKELQDLIHALRALAASHVQQAQGALEGIRQYVSVVEDAILEGAALLPETGRGDGNHATGNQDLLLVVCSEHGFVGGFNEKLLNHALAERLPDEKLVIVGQRGAGLAEERSLESVKQFPMATHVGGVLAVARRVADYMATAVRARVVYGRYEKGGRYDVALRSILPLDPVLLKGKAGPKPPLHHLDPETLITRLANEYLLAEITGAIMESLASENGARLGVMESADHNISDKLDGFERQEHSLRQESITSEMLDVVTGSEAIMSSGAI
ncbi:F0F1 ATP synthase subunit gamma [Kordiimonas marina]|uniref:F0F1 ATP synthase subunit gamma n=1 Tax=Kordiimonas marina TaxID=2872312 RepID=UPI001FF398F8|nr:FoF1 ATP synthase subunit gamma [Kordiimonas marina]MCJ9428830.1 F0F1 ATP synthase subunit gamma [Kordiimonas marina]